MPRVRRSAKVVDYENDPASSQLRNEAGEAERQNSVAHYAVAAESATLLGRPRRNRANYVDAPPETPARGRGRPRKTVPETPAPEPVQNGLKRKRAQPGKEQEVEPRGTDEPRRSKRVSVKRISTYARKSAPVVMENEVPESDQDIPPEHAGSAEEDDDNAEQEEMVEEQDGEKTTADDTFLPDVDVSAHSMLRHEASEIKYIYELARNYRTHLEQNKQYRDEDEDEDDPILAEIALVQMRCKGAFRSLQRIGQSSTETNGTMPVTANQFEEARTKIENIGAVQWMEYPNCPEDLAQQFWELVFLDLLVLFDGSIKLYIGSGSETEKQKLRYLDLIESVLNLIEQISTKIRRTRCPVDSSLGIVKPGLMIKVRLRDFASTLIKHHIRPLGHEFDRKRRHDERVLEFELQEERRRGQEAREFELDRKRRHDQRLREEEMNARENLRMRDRLAFDLKQYRHLELEYHRYNIKRRTAPLALDTYRFRPERIPEPSVSRLAIDANGVEFERVTGILGNRPRGSSGPEREASPTSIWLPEEEQLLLYGILKFHGEARLWERIFQEFCGYNGELQHRTSREMLNKAKDFQMRFVEGSRITGDEAPPALTNIPDLELCEYYK